MDSIDWISIHGFKSIRHLHRLPLRPINVLIGANGSGKSNFMQAFRWLRPGPEITATGVPESDPRPQVILHQGAEIAKQAIFEISRSNADRTERVRVRQDANGRLRTGRSPANREQAVTRKNPQAWPINRFHNNDGPGMLNGPENAGRQATLKPGARNLGGFLRHLSVHEPVQYSLICRSISLVKPVFDTFSWDQEGNIGWRQKGHTTPADIRSLSDGTIRFVALTTLLQQPEGRQPALILMEEPDAGLHPYALVILDALIRSASTVSQIVLSTHSTTLLDRFDPEDVIVAERKDRAASLRRLDPRVCEGWLDQYSLGELWQKNMLGGRPSPSTP